MASLELQKEEQTKVLSDSSATNDQVIAAGNELSAIMKAIDEKTERWLVLSEFA